MINYKVLKRVNSNNITVYYLCTNDFKYKKPRRIFDPVDQNMYVYKDFDSLYPIDKINLLTEGLFDILSYEEVEDFFRFIQNYVNSFRYPIETKALLNELESILLYWDDFN